MKLTRHNGRAGKNGTYNPKHNDRNFNIYNSEHIDDTQAERNIYWDCYNGYRNLIHDNKTDELANSFEEVEQYFYASQYQNFVNNQNARNEKNRHPERNRTTNDLLKSKKICPEESIFQIGTLDNHVSPELLFEIVTEFMIEINERFGSHVHILDWALHLDESTPHIHERHVFDCENQYGEIAPQQEKALEALGFELPDPEKPPGRKNNRKMTFDSVCRVLLFEIAKKHGLLLEEEPEYGGRAYLEKQDFIIAKQKEQLAAQERMADNEHQLRAQQEALFYRAQSLHNLATSLTQALSQSNSTPLLQKALQEGEISTAEYFTELEKYYDAADKALIAERDSQKAYAELHAAEL